MVLQENRLLGEVTGYGHSQHILCLLHHSGHDVKTPIIPAVIGIDSTTNAGFLHLIGGAKPDEVRIDMRVKAVWLEPSQRKGSITDIKYFAPLK